MVETIEDSQSHICWVCNMTLKTKDVDWLFVAFLESALNFQHFEKKKKRTSSLSISEIIDSKRHGNRNA